MKGVTQLLQVVLSASQLASHRVHWYSFKHTVNLLIPSIAKICSFLVKTVLLWLHMASKMYMTCFMEMGWVNCVVCDRRLTWQRKTFPQQRAGTPQNWTFGSSSIQRPMMLGQSYSYSYKMSRSRFGNRPFWNVSRLFKSEISPEFSGLWTQQDFLFYNFLVVPWTRWSKMLMLA